MPSDRVIFRGNDEFMARLDEARGSLSRGEYARIATEEKMAASKPKRRGAKVRSSAEYEIPKIAKAHWKP